MVADCGFDVGFAVVLLPLFEGAFGNFEFESLVAEGATGCVDGVHEAFGAEVGRSDGKVGGLLRPEVQQASEFDFDGSNLIAQVVHEILLAINHALGDDCGALKADAASRLIDVTEELVHCRCCF